MNQKEREIYLIDYLLKERHQSIDRSEYNFDLYRALVNIREPLDIPEEYLKIEDEYLKNLNRDITDSDSFNQITLWKGDITTLKVDAIVNAANNQMLGCFVPGHHCIDNAIHTYAGVRLRLKCNKIMNKQGYLEPTGKAKITPGYNLPCKYIIHTVGPIVNGRLLNKHKVLLESSYHSCLTLAVKNNIKSIAFCCISTGIFGFPKKEACRIAINTIKEFRKAHDIKVIFNVFSEEDYKIYYKILKEVDL